ncbi:MAG: hypothetical protein WBD67_09160 [Terracidiphilus sp.]
MKVTFHAYPGEELLRKGEKSQVFTGDGVYEETWLAPHHWRREVTFDGYHAVEVETDGGRKIQATSDYIPKRVVLLLRQLLHPIPREDFSEEFRTRTGARRSDEDVFAGARWKLKRITVDGQNYARVYEGSSSILQSFGAGYYFTLRGLPVLRIFTVYETVWSQYADFGGKLVPKEILIKVGGLDTVKAEVSIAHPGQTSPAEFDLPVGQADPGMTLEPLLNDPKPEALLTDHPVWIPSRNIMIYVWGAIDRSGEFREPEVIVPPGVDLKRDLRNFPMKDFRNEHFRPIEVDGSPREFLMVDGVDGRPPVVIR